MEDTRQRKWNGRGGVAPGVVGGLLVLALIAISVRPATAERDDTDVPGVFDVGVRTADFTFRSAPEQEGRQRMSNWCWAACIQMVLNYNGIRVSQEEIVGRTFGVLVDQPGSPQAILANLNGWGLRDDAMPVQVYADAFVYTANQLTYDLTIDQPLIVGLYRGGPVGHAYVLTAIRYRENPMGGEPLVLTAVLRDPWPGKPSRVEMPWTEVMAGRPFFARVRVRPLHSRQPIRAALGIHYLPAPNGGILVGEVFADTAAEEAGLRPGDVIYGLDRLPILTPFDLQSLLSHKAPGQTIRFRYLRGGTTRTGEGTLIER